MDKKDNQHEYVSDTFFFSFMGEYVELIGSFKHEGEEIGMKVEGYLLDADDTWYFLGTNEEIVQSIRQTDVTSIAIKSIESEYQTLLKDMDVPDDKNEVN